MPLGRGQAADLEVHGTLCSSGWEPWVCAAQPYKRQKQQMRKCAGSWPRSALKVLGGGSVSVGYFLVFLFLAWLG